MTSHRKAPRKGWTTQYGPWAVVTGASDGIGRAIAQELAAMGISLILVARRQGMLEDLANTLFQTHGTISRVVALDLGSTQDCVRLLAETQDLDVGLLVNCAGFGSSGSFLNNPVAVECDMINVNCTASLILTYGYAQRMVRRPQAGGGIILMSSLFGFQGVPKAANYAATKAYIQSLAEGLHQEFKADGIDVLSAAPGPILSGFGARADMKMGMGQAPEDIAWSILSALGQRTTVRPGYLSKLLEFAFLGQPRTLRSRILAKITGNMTKHQNPAPLTAETEGAS